MGNIGIKRQGNCWLLVVIGVQEDWGNGSRLFWVHFMFQLQHTFQKQYEGNSWLFISDKWNHWTITVLPIFYVLKAPNDLAMWVNNLYVNESMINNHCKCMLFQINLKLHLHVIHAADESGYIKKALYFMSLLFKMSACTDGCIFIFSPLGCFHACFMVIRSPWNGAMNRMFEFWISHLHNLISCWTQYIYNSA